MMTHQPRRPRSDDRHEDDRYDDRYDQYDDRRSRRPKKNSNPLNQISLDWMLSIGSIAIIFESCRETSLVSYGLVAAWIVLCGVVLAYTDKQAAIFQSNYRKFFKQYGGTGLIGILFTVFAITAFFFAIAEPSQAVFLTGAETAFNNVFAQGDSKTSVENLVKLVFGVIRLIILLSVIFGVIKAIQARDDSEQVKAQLMLPFIILVGIATVDVMTLLIFGT